MQMLSRREKLLDISCAATTNPSLWLDKYIKGQNYGEAQKKEEIFRQTLLEEVSKLTVPEIYSNPENGFLRRWQDALKDFGAVCKTLKLDGRMIIGLGGENVLETSITLHRVYGVPYIPGSALKGLAAAYAHKYLGAGWKKGGAFHNLVFGSQDCAGFVTFHDAFLILDKKTPSQLPLHQEIMTVHHSDYYGEGNKPPADWDSPTPIPFLSASGYYLVALSAAPELANVVTQTFDILARALETEGVGAKTSSGYGRGHFEKSAEEISDEQDKPRVEAFIRTVNSLRQNDVPGQIGDKVSAWRNLNVGRTLKAQAAQAIIEKVNKDWKKGKQKTWYQELLNYIGGDN